MPRTTTRRLFDADQDTITLGRVAAKVPGQQGYTPADELAWLSYALGEPGTVEGEGGEVYSYRDLVLTASDSAPEEQVIIKVVFSDGQAEAGGEFVWDLERLTTGDVSNESEVEGETATNALDQLNAPQATLEEMRSGTSSEVRRMTPALVKEAIEAHAKPGGITESTINGTTLSWN